MGETESLPSAALTSSQLSLAHPTVCISWGPQVPAQPDPFNKLSRICSKGSERL